MSELTNPLFEDQREFLERQKEEYKNALLSDVADLKEQSTQIGKNLLIAGGLLGGIYLLSRALHSGGEAKTERKKAKRLKAAKFKVAEDRAWISTIPDIEDDEPLYSAIERTYPAVYHPSTGTVAAGGKRKEESKLMAFFKSDLMKLVEQQLAAILMVYLTKMIEERLHTPAAPEPAVVVDDASSQTYALQPDQTLDDPASSF
ncbi:hypothetical protein [Rufibacter sp. LB8]|uniref:hypothetical protein n=1 Tax=Rufibacter sp. LB8 TaxID=2777781 RepID=UPI00178C1AD3|nr:hypothetical protein [Rufibacter sp. LB8]